MSKELKFKANPASSNLKKFVSGIPEQNDESGSTKSKDGLCGFQSNQKPIDSSNDIQIFHDI